MNHKLKETFKSIDKYLDYQYDIKESDLETEELFINGLRTGELKIDSYLFSTYIVEIIKYLDFKHSSDITFGLTRFIARLLKLNILERYDVMIVCRKFKFNTHGMSQYTKLSKSEIYEVLDDIAYDNDDERQDRIKFDKLMVNNNIIEKYMDEGRVKELSIGSQNRKYYITGNADIYSSSRITNDLKLMTFKDTIRVKINGVRYSVRKLYNEYFGK